MRFAPAGQANFFPISLDKLPQWEYNPRNLSYKLVIRFDIHPAYSLQDLELLCRKREDQGAIRKNIIQRKEQSHGQNLYLSLIHI